MPKDIEVEIDSLICPVCKKSWKDLSLVVVKPNKLVPERKDFRQIYCGRCGYQLASIHKSEVIMKQK